MFKTIIFDVDGTLLNTEPIYMRAWREAGALFGYDVPMEALLQTRAVNMRSPRNGSGSTAGRISPMTRCAKSGCGSARS